jgi:hypothetical protein
MTTSNGVVKEDPEAAEVAEAEKAEAEVAKAEAAAAENSEATEVRAVERSEPKVKKAPTEAEVLIEAEVNPELRVKKVLTEAEVKAEVAIEAEESPELKAKKAATEAEVPTEAEESPEPKVKEAHTEAEVKAEATVTDKSETVKEKSVLMITKSMNPSSTRETEARATPEPDMKALPDPSTPTKERVALEEAEKSPRKVTERVTGVTSRMKPELTPTSLLKVPPQIPHPELRLKVKPPKVALLEMLPLRKMSLKLRLKLRSTPKPRRSPKLLMSTSRVKPSRNISLQRRRPLPERKSDRLRRPRRPTSRRLRA